MSWGDKIGMSFEYLMRENKIIRINRRWYICVKQVLVFLKNEAIGGRKIGWGRIE